MQQLYINQKEVIERCFGELGNRADKLLTCILARVLCEVRLRQLLVRVEGNNILLNLFYAVCSRLAGGAQVHYEGYDSPAADWPTVVCGHPYVCHYWPGVLHGKVPHHLLR